MKKLFFWLYLEPYVFLNVVKNKAILYNTLNYKYLEYGTESPEIFGILKKLYIRRNSYCISFCYDSVNNNKEIERFIIELKQNYFGDLIPKNYSKPILSTPTINITNSIKSVLSDEELSIGFQAKLILRELTVYTGCSFSNSEYQMAVYPSSVPLKGNLVSNSNIYNLFDKLIFEISEFPYLDKINVISDNLYSCEKVQAFIRQLHKTDKKILIHIPIEEFVKNRKILQEDIEYLIYISYDYKDISKTISIQDNLKNCSFVCLVKNEKELKYFNKMNKQFFEEVDIIPLFDRNISFFKKKVFTNKKDLINQHLTIKDILTNTILNKYFFGHILLFENGEMRSHLFCEPGLSFNESNLIDQVVFELKNNYSWMKLRKDVKPCNNCAYNAFCPPISNYEFQIKKFNLCNLNN